MKRFLTLFPFSQNVHLTKDVGMIPFILHKVRGYESTIACYKIGEYPYLESEVKGLNIIFIKKVFGNEILDGLLFILKNYKKFDVLMTFHLVNSSFIWLSFFRFLKGSKGKTYLKFDANLSLLSLNISNNVYKKILLPQLRKIDLVSVETKKLCNELVVKWNLNAKCLPNGFFDNFKREDVRWEEKQNMIISVGRIGDKNKSNEILLKAFAIFFKQNQQWKLKFIGPIEQGFNKFIGEFFLSNPELKNVVEFTGNITDKKILHSFYATSKIFVLTSKSEGFPLVFLEALKSGCYILTSNTTAAFDITNQQQFGKVFEIDDVKELSALLIETSNNEKLLEMNTKFAQDFVYKQFYWPTICREIDHYLYPEFL